MTAKVAALTPEQRRAGHRHAVGRQRRPGLRLGRRRRRRPDRRRHAGRRASASKVAACIGYGAEVVLHGEHVGETFARMEAIRDEREPHLRPPVRRSGRHRRPRLDRARDPRGPARGRRRRGRHRRRRPDQRRRRRAQGTPAERPRLRRRADRVERRVDRPRARRGRLDPSRGASPTGSGRRSPGSGRWRCAGAISTGSSCSTTRRSSPACASPPSG